MALSPERLQELRQKYNIPQGGYQASTSTAGTSVRPTTMSSQDRIRDLWGDTPKPSPLQERKKLNLGQLAAEQVQGGAKKITEAVERGAQKFEQAAPGNTIKGQLERTGALLETGLGAAAGGAQAVFAPFSATLEKALNVTGGADLIEKGTQTAPAQEVLSKLDAWAEANPDTARNLMDAITVGGAALSTAGGPKNILNKDVGALTKDVVTAAKQVPADIARATTARAGTQIPKDIEFARQLTAPKITTEVAEEAIKSGRATEPGLFKKSQPIPTAKDNLIAESVADVVSPKKTVMQNVDAIQERLSQTNLNVRNMLADRKVPFNTKQLRSRLMDASEDSKLVFASEPTAQRTYDAVVDEFMKHVKNKDTLGLFEARQNFDKVPAIKKLLQTERLGENVRRQIVLDVRRAANEFVAEQLPANNPYRAVLMKESRMIEALENIAATNASTLGKNKIQLLMKEHPFLRWIVPTAAGTAIGAGGVGLFGGGGEGGR